jgi:DNA ligase D-like protein (predicted polymerase)
MATDEVRDGVELTNLDKKLFDGSQVTKRQLIDYLDAISGRMVPALAGRPLSVIRVRPGQPPFMQKNLPRYAPDWIARTATWAESSKREVTYANVEDRRTLLWFANQRAIEYHVSLFGIADPQHPDYLVMDIDPPEGAGFEQVAQAGLLVRRALADSGLDGLVKTSGAKGVHVFVPLAPSETESVAAATRALAARAERLDPDLATTAFVRADRGGKVFLDSTRAGGATVVATYSPRARAGLPVSFPIPWDDLTQIEPADFTITTAVDRLAGRDPWSELMPPVQTLPSELIDEGRRIPIARVQAMHEGKRRARAARTDAG